MHIYLTGDLIMVTLPGFFVHLLNVGIEFEPCHHILLHSKLTPTVFLQGQNFWGSLMTLCLKEGHRVILGGHDTVELQWLEH